MAKTLQKVLIMAGGTGGHVFPGLALAECLRDKHIEVEWLGTKNGLEAKLIPQAKIPLHFITINGLRGKNIFTLLLAPAKLFIAFIQSCRVLYRIKPDVVIGLGGFASGPGGVASWVMRYPLVIHEQNAKAGLTNKILASLSKKVLQGFPDTFKKRPKVVTIGNPVRQTIEAINSPAKRSQNQSTSFRLLVLGGSLGAQAINEILPKALSQLQPDERPEVWHQTGEKHFSKAQQLYQSMKIEGRLAPFIEDMAAAYQWADIVLCRAGALTVAELCAAGVGAIFIPYPYAVDDHQTANANYMVRANAAICIQQVDLTDQNLAAMIKDFSLSPQKAWVMAEKAYSLRLVDVSERIFDILSEVNSHQGI